MRAASRGEGGLRGEGGRGEYGGLRRCLAPVTPYAIHEVHSLCVGSALHEHLHSSNYFRTMSCYGKYYGKTQVYFHLTFALPLCTPLFLASMFLLIATFCLIYCVIRSYRCAWRMGTLLSSEPTHLFCMRTLSFEACCFVCCCVACALRASYPVQPSSSRVVWCQ